MVFISPFLIFFINSKIIILILDLNLLQIIQEKEVIMFQAIISVCNLINMECVLLKDKIGLINTHKQCKIRAESMRKDFIDLYKGPVIIEKNCIKINNYKSI